MGGKAYALRPTFDVLCQIEDALDMPLVSIPEALVSQQFKFRDLCIVTTLALKAANDDLPDDDELGQMMAELGMIDLMGVVSDLVMNGLTGGKSPGKQKAASNSKSTPSRN